MNCPHCGTEIVGRAVFCPQCGRKLQAERQGVDASQSDPQIPEPAPARGCRTTLGVIGVALLVMLIIGLIGGAAIFLGLRDRSGLQVDLAREHYERGETHFSEERYELAIAEYELALQLDPGYSRATERLNEARARLAPPPTSAPPDTAGPHEDYWEQLRAAADRGDWAVVIQRAEQLRALDPTYRQDEMIPVLVDAYYHLGQAQVEQDRLEDAIRLFDRGLDLQPGNARLSLAKSMAKLYMDGLRYSGADWAQAIDRLAALYRLDPGYRDVQTRLQAAYIGYGDQLASQESWCQALVQFQRGSEIEPTTALDSRIERAADRCEDAALDDDQPQETGTPTPESAAPSGTYVARVESREQIGGTSVYVRGRILDSNGRPVRDVRVRIQAWDWSAYAISDGSGQFSFDGLGNPVPYTLTLADLPSVPIEVETEPGQMTWVAFEETR